MEPLEFIYTNYSGKTQTRKVIPTRFFYGTRKPHYTQKMWLLEAWDCEKQEMRCFDVAKLRGRNTPASDLMRAAVNDDEYFYTRLLKELPRLHGTFINTVAYTRLKTKVKSFIEAAKQYKMEY